MWAASLVIQSQKLRVGQFLAVIEQMQGDAKSWKIPGGHGDGSLRRIDPRDDIIETPAIEYGDSQFRRALPIRGAQII